MTNQDLESCKRDIEIIKSTIEKSKVNLESIAKLFIIYGCSIFAIILTRNLLSHFKHEEAYPFIYGLTAAASLVVSLILLVVYLKDHQRLQKMNHIYTLQLYRLWGFTMLFLPLFSSCSSLCAQLLFGDQWYIGARCVLHILPCILEVVAYAFSLLYTGISLNKKPFIVVSILMMPVILLIFYVGSSYPQGSETAYQLMLYSYFSNRVTLCKALIMLGYIVLGMILLPKKANDYGTE